MCLQTFQVSEEKQTVKRGERNPCPEEIFNDDQTIERKGIKEIGSKWAPEKVANREKGRGKSV